MSGPRSSPRFPHPAWAWPRGGLDSLLVAVTAGDYDRGLRHARRWLAEHSIDDAQFREQRLLAAVVHRYGRDLSDLAAYPRLSGLQKLLWSRARLAARESIPVLRQISRAGIEYLLIKGAARTATDPQAHKARMSHDLDLLVRPDDYARTFALMTAAGWAPSGGQSGLCMAARLPHLPSVNLYRGHFADIDLHQCGYGLDERLRDCEQALWLHREPGDFLGVAADVPSPTECIALAIRSSALEAHAHSDWLVDCAHFVATGRVDWARLGATVEAVGMRLETLVALGYLRERLGLAVPDEALPRIGGWSLARHLPQLLQAKPRTDLTPLSRLGQAGAKQLRLLRERRRRREPPILRGAIGAGGSPAHLPGERDELARGLDAGTYRFDLRLAVELDGQPRRIEFELNTESAHIARLRVRNLLRRRGPCKLRFRGSFDLAGSAALLRIEARPNRHMRRVAGDEDGRRHGAVPFALLSFSLVRERGE